MANSFTSYTREQEKAIHQTLLAVGLRSNVNWPAVFLNILLATTSIPWEGRRLLSPPKIDQRIRTFVRALDAVVQVYDRLDPAIQWHIKRQISRRSQHSVLLSLDQFLKTLEAMKTAAQKTLGRGNRILRRKGGAPKKVEMRDVVKELLRIFKYATATKPTVFHNNRTGSYGGTFYPFAVACLTPVTYFSGAELGSAIRTAFREIKRRKPKR